MKIFSIALLLATTSAIAAAPKPPAFDHADLGFGLWRIKAEVANSEPQRQHGLMYREKMPANHGMLFVFERAQQYCMWMKNTLLPLSVAFLDEQGRVINIADMQPQTETSHCADKAARFALEMNLGWFKNKHVTPGAKLDGLEKYGIK